MEGCNREFADRQAASGVQSVYIVLQAAARDRDMDASSHQPRLTSPAPFRLLTAALPVLPRKLLSTASSPLLSAPPWRYSISRCPHEPSFPEFCLCWPQPCPAKTFDSREHEVRILHTSLASRRQSSSTRFNQSVYNSYAIPLLTVKNSTQQ